jgi:hypothetical protein
LADQEGNVLGIAWAENLREALQELAGPLRDLANQLWVEATEEPERRRAALIEALRAQTGAFPPCNRRHPRYPARLPAWWTALEGGQALPAETVNVSSMGLRLALPEGPAPGTRIQILVETPFGLVKGEGRIAWTRAEAQGRHAGIGLSRLQDTGDRVRWDSLIAQLADRVGHA